MKNNLLIKYLALFSFSSLLVLPACKDNNDDKKPEARDVFIRLVSPADGSSFSLSDDIYPQAAGIQINLQAQVAGIDSGHKVTLTNKSTTPATAIQATIFNSLADFNRYTLNYGKNELTLSAEQGEYKVSRDFVLYASDSGLYCSLLAPRNGAKLTTDSNSDLDYFQSDLTLACQGSELSGLSDIYISINGATPLKTALAHNGRAVFTDITLAEGQNIIAIGASAQLPIYNNISCLEAAGKCAVVNVDTPACRLSLDLIESRNYLFQDDRNHDYRDGLQLQIAADSDCPADSTVSLLVADSAAALNSNLAQQTFGGILADTPSGRRFIFDNITVTSPGEEGLVTKYIQAIANDAQHSRSLPVVITADGYPPVFETVFPADGANISAKTFNIGATLSGIEAGQDVEVILRDFEQLSNVITSTKLTLDNDKTISFPVTVEKGRYQLSMVAADAAGNITQSLTSFSSGIYDHQINITTAANSCFNNNNVIIEGTIDPAGSFSCSLWTKAEEQDDFVKLLPAVTSSADGTFTLQNINGLLPGRNLVQVSCANNNDIVGFSSTTTIFVDNEAPYFVAEAAYVGLQNGQRLGGQDSNNELPGFQRDIILSIPADTQEYTTNGLTVILEAIGAGGEQLFSSSQPWNEGNIIFKDVTLMAEGSDVTTTKLNAYLLDCGGNRSQPFSIVLDLNTNGPTITLVAPGKTSLNAEDDLTPSSIDDIAVDFQYTVTGVTADSLAYLTFSPACLKGICNEPIAATAEINGQIATYTFKAIPLDIGNYTASFSITDNYGNTALKDFAFVVADDSNKIEITSPAKGANYSSQTDVNTAKEGYQGNFMGTVFGHPIGSIINFCSTAAASNNEPCRNGGYILASATNSGIQRRSTVYFNGITLPEGEQTIHLEVSSGNNTKQAESETRTIIVDTTPPAITAFTFTQNKTENDKSEIVYLNISAEEGTNIGGKLSTAIEFSIDGLNSQRLVKIFSDLPVPGTLVGSKYSNGSLTRSTIKLAQGLQHLTVEVLDDFQNKNSVNEFSHFTVYADADLPTVAVASPVKSIYTSEDGQVVGNVMFMPIQVTVGDSSSLRGSQVTLTLNNSYGQQWQEPRIIANNKKQEILIFNVPFIQGGYDKAQNTLVATVTDAGGNTNTSEEIAYTLDYTGADIHLLLENVISGQLAECQANNGCNVTMTTADDNGRIPGYSYLDNSVNDLLIKTEGCPCTISLESNLTDSPIIDTVFNSTFVTEENANISYRNISTKIGGIGPGFLPGQERSIKLKAIDANGNVTYSQPLYLNINYVSSVLITVERADPQTSQPIGLFVNDGDYFGPNDQVTNAAGFLSTILAVRIDDFTDRPLTDAKVKIEITSPAGTRTYPDNEVDSNNVSRPTQVELEVSNDLGALNKNNIVITVTDKNNHEIGRRQLSDIIADISAPTYKWRRNGNDRLGGLEQFNVTYDQTGIIGDALWNSSLDKVRGDAIEDNGFNTSTTALVVEISNIEERQLVTLNSDQAGYILTGNTARTSDCDERHNCLAIFNNLAVPSLPDGQKHHLTLSITDQAGNQASSDTNEVISAIVDTISPNTIIAYTCLGEDMAPVGNSEAKYQENELCEDICTDNTCSRREGKVTLVWSLDNDNRQDGAINHYLIGYRPLGGDEANYLASCADIEGSLADPQNSAFNAQSVNITADLNGLAQYTLSGLPIHQEYCFVIQAFDQNQNYSEIMAESTQRVIPLKSWPEAGTFETGITNGRDDSVVAFESDSAQNENSYGSTLKNVGDIDGDGLDDFAAGNFMYNMGAGMVELFLSGSQQITKGQKLISSLVITINDSSFQMFGTTLAGADLNGDGHNELIIGASGMANYNGSGTPNGAVFIYDGTRISNGQLTENSTNNKWPDYQPTTVLYYDYNSYTAFGAALATGDINNDGLEDLLVSTNSDGKIFGFLGREDFPTGDVFISNNDDGSANNADLYFSISTFSGDIIALGDFNNDNNIDLITTDAANGYDIFFGPLNKTAYTSADATAFAPADFDSSFNGAILPLNNQLALIYSTGSEYKLGLFNSSNGTMGQQALATYSLAQNTTGGYRLDSLYTRTGNDRLLAVGDPDNGMVRIIAAKLENTPALDLQSIIYGSKGIDGFSSFGYGLANIGTFMGQEYNNALLVNNGSNGNGSLYLYW